MKKVYIRPLLILMCLILAFVSCAKPPEEEMNNAAAAVTKAENDPDAVAFGAAHLNRARDALQKMQTEADSKRYDAAKTLAAEAVSAAERAVSEGKAGAQRALSEARNLLDGIKTSIGEAEKALDAAWVVKNISLDFDTMNRRMEEAKKLADEAELSLAKNAAKEAQDKAQQARTILADIINAVSSAARAVSKKQ
ncbi:DUF4398 domain-containing protein [Treponema sp. OttesenSCG-928-L16]|nr:DUF4398 domain-containing protein [Treponema sp. OttesenSCG-928-L16]